MLNGDLHDRLNAAVLNTSRVVQAILLKGAEMVMADLQERHPWKAG